MCDEVRSGMPLFRPSGWALQILNCVLVREVSATRVHSGLAAVNPLSFAALLAALFFASPVLAQDPSQIELGANVSLGGLRLLPEQSPWNKDISGEPVDPNSDKILARIGLTKALHPDFGGVHDGAPAGLQYVVVSKDQAMAPITFANAEESDPGPYPIPPDAPIEGGPKAKGDRRVIVLDRDSWVAWEALNVFPDGNGGWKADSGAIWDLKQNHVRPAGWTSADAAGLPILPGLVRYDEVVEKQAINHALRFTVRKTRQAYVPPASHWASKFKDGDLPPMGMRVRLKADYDLSSFPPEVKAILEALKKYGMILSGNGGDNFIGGAHHPLWNDGSLRQIKRVQTKDFEVVLIRGMVVDTR